METFASDWLTLREAADARSRNEKLLSHLRLPEKDPVRVVDLAAGTGSNLRYLSPRLSRRQVWTLVDQDKKLLILLMKSLMQSRRFWINVWKVFYPLSALASPER